MIKYLRGFFLFFFPSSHPDPFTTNKRGLNTAQYLVSIRIRQLFKNSMQGISSEADISQAVYYKSKPTLYETDIWISFVKLSTSAAKIIYQLFKPSNTKHVHICICILPYITFNEEKQSYDYEYM